MLISDVLISGVHCMFFKTTRPVYSRNCLNGVAAGKPHSLGGASSNSVLARRALLSNWLFTLVSAIGGNFAL